MKRNLIKILSVTMFVSLFSVVAATRNANALSISIEDLVGGTSIVVSDESADDVMLGTEGILMYNGTVGDWDFNATTGISSPAIGSLSNPELHLNNVDISSAAGGALKVMVTAQDFDNIGSISEFLFSVGGVTSGTADFDLYLDDSNAEFGMGTLLGSLGQFTPFSFKGEIITALPNALSGPFSLTMVAVITHTAKGITSFDANTAPVPEPATMFLLGSGLLGMAATKRRKKEEV